MQISVSWKTYKNTRYLASIVMQFYQLGLESQNKKEFAKTLGTLVHDSNFNIVSYCTFKNFMQGNKVVLSYSHHIDPL
jgi:hypothetical protein